LEKKGYIKNLFLNNRFFFALGIVITLFILSYYFAFLWHISWVALFLIILLTTLDYILLFFTAHRIIADRKVSEKLSNGDENLVTISVYNAGRFESHLSIIDEVPHQFQLRNFTLNDTIKGLQKKVFKYNLTPKERGIFSFGDIIIFAKSPIGILERRHIIDAQKDTKVYPSYLQIKKQTLRAFSYDNTNGESKHKRMASSLEFDHIKEYVRGDDVRNINWKATARKNSLMVNTFIDERSQNIYLVVDKGRTMYYPFDGMSLLDYSINSALMLSYAILHKNDKVGLITFNKKLDSFIAPNKTKTQLHRITEVLYRQETTFNESDYEVLTNTIRFKAGQRSFILLYTNFETIHAVQRHMSYLKNIASRHLLCVVIFENNEIAKIQETNTDSLEGIYVKTIADQFAFEKKLIIKELHKQGIHTIYTSPQNLNTDALNKYLELKEKRLI
jgi:uncharacterized protein (DUF58 family)